ncbi:MULTISPECIES: acyl carrier protein [unclassified Streptomyces]|uniref:acyl carrier protein n=1 Tax=unclassified Streptomyces TaxID=2593676 RepID=UPI00166162C1|nr:MULTISPECIES: acyl carrier protein [unclassified Streptomyces]MBD0711211.1 hypothetical protein [Streptomyces sp. CBMA291]MBD0714242.1 hypothetical protein [Streptomyces sp. CBMA370]
MPDAEQLVRYHLSKILDRDLTGLAPETDLERDLEVDSLDVAELSAALKGAGVDVSREEVAAARRYGDLIALVGTALTGDGAGKGAER